MSKAEDPKDQLDELDTLNEDSEFDSFLNKDENDESASAPAGIGFLKNLPVKLTVEVDSVGITVRDLLSAKPGEVLELSKQVGEPMDVMANGELFGKAEVVVVDNKYGIRILEVFGQGDGEDDPEES